MSDQEFICAICGGTTYSVSRTLTDLFADCGEMGSYELVRCVACGLLCLHPQPDAETRAAAYAATWALDAQDGLSSRAAGWVARRSARSMQRYFAEPRRVLDISCATDVTLAKQAIRVAPASGLDVCHNTLKQAAFPDASADTVILAHTLERVSDPIATLREVWRVLAPGGAIIIGIPNADSIEARVLGRRWIGYDAPRHLTTFSLRTLSLALEATGFRIAHVKHEAIGLEWAWAFRLWLRDRWPISERVIRPLHPLLIVAATPLAALGAFTRRSGRIRVIAVKPVA
jgi:SAM-dependent methyltransferase